ncbi:MAG: hypothetical protein CL663_07360 [Bacteroidetes bacterium]|nr:hypothetical protein [Bacteroidota bacterium]|tara:strand:- start:884 stop:1246 length:363 start_codon:yes stop_codon:yes gene_type:complete
MSTPIHRQEGFFHTLAAAVLIIAVSLTTSYFKNSLSTEYVNIKIYGNLGIIIAIGLILKWKYIPEVTGGITFLACTFIFISFFFANTQHFLQLIALLIVLIIITYLLLFNTKVKAFQNSK